MYFFNNDFIFKAAVPLTAKISAKEVPWYIKFFRASLKNQRRIGIQLLTKSATDLFCVHWNNRFWSFNVEIGKSYHLWVL